MKQIVIQPQAVGFCRFHQRIDDCTRLRTLGCIGKEPSLPANDKRADGVFNLVVADFNLTMLKKRTEVRPATRTLCVLNFVVAAYPSVIRTPLNPSRKSEHGIVERLQVKVTVRIIRNLFLQKSEFNAYKSFLPFLKLP